MKFRCISCGWKSDVQVAECEECGKKDPFQQNVIAPIFKIIGFVIFLIIIGIFSWNA